MNVSAETFSTPLGLFSIAVNDAGEVLATAFGDRAALQARLGQCPFKVSPSPSRKARDQIMEYFAGQRRSFDLPLAPTGTPFQQRIWSALREIPFGETRTYGQLATQVGNPAASRAVGRANATNPICLIVPCHRVIGANGSLTGFAFGESLKRRLLEHEQVPTFAAA